jgi:hypothetical protein
MRVKDERAFPRFDCPLPDASPTTGGCVMAEAAQKTPVNPKKRGSSKAPPSGRRSPICAANSIECSRTFPGAGADWLGRLKAVAPTDRAVDVAANIAKATGSKLSILNVGGNLSGDEMPRRKGSRRCARCHLEPNCHAVQGASKTDRGVDHQGPSCLGRSGRGDHRSCPARAGECYRGRQTGQGGALPVRCWGACHRRSQASLLAL